MQHEGLRAMQETEHLMGISVYQSFCLTKESTDSSSCSSEVHGKTRERGRCQRVKCWLLPYPEQNSFWSQLAQLFTFRFQGWGRLLNVLSKIPTSKSSSTCYAPNLLVKQSSGPQPPLSLGYTTASHTLGGISHLVLLIVSGLNFDLLGCKQCRVLYDKGTCPSWTEGCCSQRHRLESCLVLLWLFQVAKRPYVPWKFFQWLTVVHHMHLPDL